MSSLSSIDVTNPPKTDKRSGRLGRFEIVITDLVKEERGPRGRLISTTKVGTAWHKRWLADGNLRKIHTSESLTSKRNAERAILAEAGVREVIQEGDKQYAVLVDGTRRPIVVVDERDPSL